jgi:uncharacterized protein YqkB
MLNLTVLKYSICKGEVVLNMEIALTELAAEKLSERIAGKDGFIKLKYDIDGCGCVVSGVTALWLVNDLDEDDREIKTNAGSIYAEKSKEVFLDDDLTIDFSVKANCFQLKSPNQYLNPRMSFIDKTK